MIWNRSSKNYRKIFGAYLPLGFTSVELQHFYVKFIQLLCVLRLLWYKLFCLKYYMNVSKVLCNKTFTAVINSEP